MAAFVDTNIFLYAFAINIRPMDHHKPSIAKALIMQLIRAGDLIVSTQVLNELYTNLVREREGYLTHEQAAIAVRELAREPVVPVDDSLVLLALDRVQKSEINYWDALMVEAALRAGATILYSEDMQHGMRYGALEIRNPFK